MIRPGGLRQTTGTRDGPPWKSVLRNLFSIDCRSLALFRIAMGILLLVDLAIRATDLQVMYTDDGMFPRALIRHHYASWNWSFHFGSGSWLGQAALFAVAVILALALLVGFETRIAVVGSWLMLISIHHRVPPILSGADILFRMLLFWAMFLPLERMWSLDRWLEKRHGSLAMDAAQSRVLSVASAAILLQMALMYLFSAIFKSTEVWWRGEALAGILAHDFYASPAGGSLLQFPRLLTGLTRATLVLEWAALLLFFPLWTAWVRLWLVAALTAMHVGIGVCLNVDLFSPVSIAGLVLFLPPAFWNRRLPDATASTNAGNNLGQKRGRLFFAQQGLCLLLFFYVVAINIDTLPSHPLGRLAPEKWKPLAAGCGFGQRWGMFESIPSNDGWYVARAQLRDGSEVDLLRSGAAIDWQRPADPAGSYPNHRWRKLFREMAYFDELGFQVFRAPVAKHLCRAWNGRAPAEKQVAEFEFIYCMEIHGNDEVSPPQILRQPLVHLDLRGR